MLVGAGTVLAINQLKMAMVRPDLIKEGRFDEIARLTREVNNIMVGFELKHIGINCPNESEAKTNAEFLSELIGFSIKEGSS